MKNIINYIIALVLVMLTNLSLSADGKKIPICNNDQPAFLPASERSNINGRADGTIICWLEEVNNGSLWIQKMDNIGKIMWTVNGVQVDSYLGNGFSENTDYPLIFSDDKGGVIIIYRKVFFDREDIYMQKADKNGNCLLNPICLSAFYEGYNYSPSAVKTNNGDIAVTWENFTTGNFDIHAQMLDPAGNKLWNTGREVVVCNADNDQRKPTISCGQNNNITVSWLDARNHTDYSFDLFANLLDSKGNSITYKTKGKMLFRNAFTGNSRKDVLYNHNIVPSENNTFIIAFEHSFDNRYSDINILKFNDNLDREWIIDFGSGSHQSNPLITPDNNSGAGIIWNDESEGRDEIFGVVVNKDGNIIWGSKYGSLISCDVSKIHYQRIIPSGSILNGFFIRNDKIFLNWVTTNTHKLFLTNLYLADESTQCENTLEIQDEMSEGEYTSITSNGNNAVIIYRQSGNIFASVRNISGVGFAKTENEPQLDNFPNPFNPTTNLYFTIPFDGFVRLSVYDITGRMINTLVNEYKNAGKYVLKFSGSDLSSGIYFCRLEFNGAAHTIRMTMLK